MLGVLILIGKVYLGVTLGAGTVLAVLVLRDHITGRASRWTA